MGVRISWLMLARKLDLARLASSAASSSASRCSISTTRWMMLLNSLYMTNTNILPPNSMPATSRSGLPKKPTAR